MGTQSAGPQQVFWDGRDEEGRLLPPGLYLVVLHLDSELEELRRMQPVGIAY